MLFKSFLFPPLSWLLPLFARQPQLVSPTQSFEVYHGGTLVYTLPEGVTADYEMLPKGPLCPRSCFKFVVRLTWPNLPAVSHDFLRVLEHHQSQLVPQLKTDSTLGMSFVVGDIQFLSVETGATTLLCHDNGVVVSIPAYARYLVRLGKGASHDDEVHGV